MIVQVGFEESFSEIVAAVLMFSGCILTGTIVSFLLLHMKSTSSNYSTGVLLFNMRCSITDFLYFIIYINNCSLDNF
jgi:hypothetical protein